jgi:hypothetical protein
MFCLGDKLITTNKITIDNSLKESLLKLIELSKSKVVQNQVVTFEINVEVKDLLEVELKKDCSEYHFQIFSPLLVFSPTIERTALRLIVR